jgi:glycosyltransferase involved in cell wall biosynthesis
VVRYLDEKRITVVILNGFSTWTFLRVLAACRRRDVPVFLRGDSNIRGDHSRGWLRHFLKRMIIGWAIRQSSGVMPMGEFGQMYFEKYGAVPESCFWVPYEPDYAHFESVDPARVTAFCRERRLAPGRKRILFSGRLVPVKRVDMAIDGFEQIADARPDWDLLIAGDGPLGERLRERLGGRLNHRIHWLGMCTPSEIRSAYAASDVLVLPSEFEPWGLVVNEGMAAGLPVIASDTVGAAHELIRDGQSGRVFKTGNLDLLVESLLEVTDPHHLGRYEEAVSISLAEWRHRADPIDGIRAALRSIALLP